LDLRVFAVVSLFGRATYTKSSNPEFTPECTTLILVGGSDNSGKASVQLDRYGMTVSPNRVNDLHQNWPDAFRVTVVGKTLYVDRTDNPGHQWGQQLVLRATYTYERTLEIDNFL
jgi:hypothetical protein